MNDEQRRYAVWLSLTLGAGNPKAKQLLSLEGDFAAVYARRQELARLYRDLRLGKDFADRVPIDAADAVLRRCVEKKITVFTPQLPGWPAVLNDLVDPPAVLYAAGHTDRLGELGTIPAVSVVGTRKMSEHGQLAALEFSHALALCGIAVISGMASGIDSQAHRGALDAGGFTAAVLGCGLTEVYPKSNRALMTEIFHKGLLITEYPPDAAPEAWNFPVRNRLISALSWGTLVIETRDRSGALITARLAAEQGREVFGLMSDYNRPGADSMRGLIDDGATPVSDVGDLWQRMQPAWPDALSPVRLAEAMRDFGRRYTTPEPETKKPAARSAAPKAAAPTEDEPPSAPPTKTPEQCSARGRMVWEKLPDGEAIHIDDLSERLDLASPLIVAALTELELAGLVKICPGRYYKRT